jgi:predicted nuclease of predicted toxin-antitoxin system
MPLRGVTIVTADSDFIDLAQSHGAPPKVVHLENYDYRTAEVESLLRQHAVRIAELERSPRVTLTLRNKT